MPTTTAGACRTALNGRAIAAASPSQHQAAAAASLHPDKREPTHTHRQNRPALLAAAVPTSTHTKDGSLHDPMRREVCGLCKAAMCNTTSSSITMMQQQAV
jgi:hypothetical protein